MISNDAAIEIVAGSSTAFSYIDFTTASTPPQDYKGRLLYSLQDNFMSFVTNETEKMRIDSAGNVGIGNLTLANGSITDSSGTISFGNGNLTTTGTLGCGAITSSGNVGIGTTNPESSLHVAGSRSFAPSSRGIHMGIDAGNGTAIEIVGLNNGFSYIDFTTASTPPQDYKGRLLYSLQDNFMSFVTNAVERMQIKNNGTLLLREQNGGAIIEGFDANHAIYLRIAYDNTTYDVLDFHEFGDIRFFTGGDIANQTEKMRITAGGNVGIGTNNPQAELHINQGGDPGWGSINDNGARFQNGNTHFWNIGTGGGGNFLFSYLGGTNAFISKSDGNPNQLDFTGQHRSILNKNIDIYSVGLIVSSNGKYINLDNSLNTNINESLPICSISNIDNDIKVFGVISDKEDTNSNRTYETGAFVTPYEKTNKNEQRMFINSLGEGAIWVCNKNGILVNGDYISSSSVPGYGMKQTLNQNILANHTVAKITCDCDFSLTKIVKQKLKVITTTETYETNVTQDVEKTNTETKIRYDETLQKYIEETITTTTTEEEQVYDTFDLYDSSGNVLVDSDGNTRTHKVERKETKTKIITEIDYDVNGDVQYEDDLDADGNQQMIYPFETRFLQADAKQITEEEYNTKLAADETVYIACFVGCTYHCG